MYIQVVGQCCRKTSEKLQEVINEDNPSSINDVLIVNHQNTKFVESFINKEGKASHVFPLAISTDCFHLHWR